MVDGHEDFLDEIVAEATERNPDFPAMMDAARARRELVKALVAKRQEKRLTQTEVAARMKTSQSAVARLEGHDDARASTIDRYALAIGVRVERRIVDPG